MISTEQMNKINDIVKEALPAALAEELRTELNTLVALRKSADALAANVSDLNKENYALQEKIRLMSLDLCSHMKLDVREKEISAKENKLEIELLKKDVACSERITNRTHELVDRFVRNTEVKKHSFGSVPHQHPGQTYLGSASTSNDETITEE